MCEYTFFLLHLHAHSRDSRLEYRDAVTRVLFYREPLKDRRLFFPFFFSIVFTVFVARSRLPGDGPRLLTRAPYTPSSSPGEWRQYWFKVARRVPPRTSFRCRCLLSFSVPFYQTQASGAMYPHVPKEMPSAPPSYFETVGNSQQQAPPYPGPYVQQQAPPPVQAQVVVVQTGSKCVWVWVFWLYK